MGIFGEAPEIAYDEGYRKGYRAGMEALRDAFIWA